MNRIARSISPATRSYRSPAREVSTNSWFHSCTLAQVGHPAAGDRPHQVHRRAGVRVRADHPDGSGTRAAGVGGQRVDDVAAVGRQAERVGVGRSRLGVLAGDPADLHHRQRRAVGQHDRHLQQRPDVAARMCGSVLSTNVSAQSPPCSRNASPRATAASCVVQPVDLARHRDRRHRLEHGAHGEHLLRVRPLRLLGRRQGQRPRRAGPAGPRAAAAGSAERPPGCRSSSSRGKRRQSADVRRATGLTANASTRSGADALVQRRAWARCLPTPEPARVGERVVPVGRRAAGMAGQPAASQCWRISRVRRGTGRGRSGMVPHSCAEGDVVVGAVPGPELDRAVPAASRNSSSSSRMRAGCRQAGVDGGGSLSARAGVPRAGRSGRTRSTRVELAAVLGDDADRDQLDRPARPR